MKSLRVSGLAGGLALPCPRPGGQSQAQQAADAGDAGGLRRRDAGVQPDCPFPCRRPRPTSSWAARLPGPAGGEAAPLLRDAGAGFSTLRPLSGGGRQANRQGDAATAEMRSAEAAPEPPGECQLRVDKALDPTCGRPWPAARRATCRSSSPRRGRKSWRDAADLCQSP